MKPTSHQQGLTLIELIISITILSISLTAIISVFANSATNNAAPMAREQANFIANAYMEEIMLQAYLDPSTDTGTCEELSRALYDDVNDYGCVNDTAGAVDQNGSLIAELAAYNVDVDVTPDNLYGAIAQRIDVVVTRDNLDSINMKLTAYRTIY